MKKTYQFLKTSRINIGGTHIFGNLYGVKINYLTNGKLLENIIKSVAKTAKVHIIKIFQHKYEIRYYGVAGISIIAFLKESHILIHTWPEGNYATVDIFSCGKESSAKEAFKKLISILKPKKYKFYVMNRSYIIKPKNDF